MRFYYDQVETRQKEATVSTGCDTGILIIFLDINLFRFRLAAVHAVASICLPFMTNVLVIHHNAVLFDLLHS